MSQLLNRKGNENKINHLITSYCRAENQLLTFSEIMQILLTQGIFNHFITFKIIYDKFQQAYQVPSISSPKKINAKVIDTLKPNQSIEKTLTKQQFAYFLKEIGNHIYKGGKKAEQRLFSQFLVDKSQVSREQRVRAPIVDQNTKKFLTQQAILQISKYQNDLRQWFVCYIWQNYQMVKNNNRILLQPQDVYFQNKRMITVGFVSFIKQSEICPTYIMPDHLQQIVRSIVPPLNQKQQHFYYKKLLSELYYDNLSKRSKSMTDVNDPGINFLQFLFILMKIGFDSYPKQLQKKGVQFMFRRFFDKIGLKDYNNKQLKQRKTHIKYIQTCYKDLIGKQFKSLDLQQIQENNRYEHQEKLKQQLFGQEMQLDIIEILKTLDRSLPNLPELPHVNKQSNKDQQKRINIGIQAPLQNKQKQVQKPKQPKKQAKLKQDQDPPRVFQWAPIRAAIIDPEDYLKQLSAKLSTQTKPLSSLQRGTINVEALPIVISQTVFPVQLPKDSQANLTSFKSCLVDRNYILALQNLDLAFNNWKKYLSRNGKDMTIQTQLFFQYSKGSIFCSSGKYNQALNYFLNCRKITEGGKMNFSNPDRSLPYMGIGQIFYQLQEYELSARSYLKARQIRQSILSLQHVQTATVFCNLGACFFMLKRNVQSLGYTQIAQNVLSTELGPYHQRTITAKLNLKKIRRGQFDNHPQHRTLWQVFQKDQFEGGGKKKNKSQKKK